VCGTVTWRQHQRKAELSVAPELAVVAAVLVCVAVGVAQQPVLGLGVVVRALRLGEDRQGGRQPPEVADAPALVDRLDLLAAVGERLQLGTGDHAAAAGYHLGQVRHRRPADVELVDQSAPVPVPSQGRKAFSSTSRLPRGPACSTARDRRAAGVQHSGCSHRLGQRDDLLDERRHVRLRGLGGGAAAPRPGEARPDAALGAAERPAPDRRHELGHGGAQQSVEGSDRGSSCVRARTRRRPTATCRQRLPARAGSGRRTCARRRSTAASTPSRRCALGRSVRIRRPVRPLRT
jgi:hypothetical protein